jgi:hypothetical protein
MEPPTLDMLAEIGGRHGFADEVATYRHLIAAIGARFGDATVLRFARACERTIARPGTACC